MFIIRNIGQEQAHPIFVVDLQNFCCLLFNLDFSHSDNLTQRKMSVISINATDSYSFY